MGSCCHCLRSIIDTVDALYRTRCYRACWVHAVLTELSEHVFTATEPISSLNSHCTKVDSLCVHTLSAKYNFVNSALSPSMAPFCCHILICREARCAPFVSAVALRRVVIRRRHDMSHTTCSCTAPHISCITIGTQIIEAHTTSNNTMHILLHVHNTTHHHTTRHINRHL